MSGTKTITSLEDLRNFVSDEVEDEEFEGGEERKGDQEGASSSQGAGEGDSPRDSEGAVDPRRAEPEQNEPASAQAGEGEAGGEGEQTEWQPNYKFKVLDEEKEFEDFIKPIVNKDNYDKIKEMHEKAYGLDHVKSKYQTTKEDYDKLKEDNTKNIQALGKMGHLIQNKDYGTLFKEMGLSDQDVMNYALERANYHELPADQRQAHDQQVQEQQRLRNLELENQQLKQQQQRSIVQSQEQMLDNYLSSPEIADHVRAFDERAGKPGSFKEEVIRRGAHAYYTQKTQIPVSEAANQVISLYGGKPMNQEAPAAGNAPQANNQPPVYQQKPTIPKMKAVSGQAPAKRMFTSLDELRTYANSLE